MIETEIKTSSNKGAAAVNLQMKTITKFSIMALVTGTLLVGCATSHKTAREAVTRYRSETGTNNTVRIKGTGSLHDWRVEGGIIDGYIEVPRDFPVQVGKATAGRVPAKVEFSIPVCSLKSVTLNDKPFSRTMDDIMCHKLREASHERIRYSLIEATLKEVPRGNSRQIMETKGNLTVAGVTREVAMPVAVEAVGDKLRCSAQVAIKMSDFGIELSVLETTDHLQVKLAYDEVNLSVEWVVVKAAD